MGGNNKKSYTWLIVLFIFILGLGFYFLVYRNIVLKTEDLNSKIKTLKTQITVKTRIASKLNQYRDELSNMKEAFHKLSQYLTKTTEISDYLVEIGNILTTYHITPVVFQPGEEKFEKGKSYGTFPVSLRIKCDFFTLIKILDKFENGEKLVYVNQINVVSANENRIDAEIGLSLLLQKEGVKF